MDGYHEKKVVEQAVGKRGREAENKQRKRYKNEGVRRGGYKALKRPPVKGKNPMKTSRVEKSKVRRVSKSIISVINNSNNTGQRR